MAKQKQKQKQKQKHEYEVKLIVTEFSSTGKKNIKEHSFLGTPSKKMALDEFKFIIDADSAVQGISDLIQNDNHD